MKSPWENPSDKRGLKRLYTRLLPTIRKVARQNGYAIGVHGSMTRDFDLIAVPWVTGRVIKPVTLANRIQEAVCKIRCTVRHDAYTKKPHGRLAFVVVIGMHGYIDLSVTPSYGAYKKTP